MLQSEKLTWEEIEPAAKQVFRVWIGQPELKWAKQAWELMGKAGFTSYTNELERHTVAIRFLALAAFYNDFCEVMWEEPTLGEAMLMDVFELLVLEPFQIGQLVGRDAKIESVFEALWSLVNKARDTVFRALLVGFEDTQENPATLFISLYRSNHTREDEGEEEGDETDWEIVNEVTDEKLAAFTWLTEGAPPLH